MIRRYEVTDEEWEKLKKYFPERQAGTLGRPRKDSQKMLNGIFWIARSGASWRDLPERYGPWQTVYKRFAEWQKSGLIEKIFHELGEDADLEDISKYLHQGTQGKRGCRERGRKIAKRRRITPLKRISALGSVVAAEAPRFMQSWTLLAPHPCPVLSRKRA